MSRKQPNSTSRAPRAAKKTTMQFVCSQNNVCSCSTRCSTHAIAKPKIPFLVFSLSAGPAHSPTMFGERLVSHSYHAGSSGITIVWPALRRLRISAPTRRSRRLEERWISVRWAKQERLARRLSPLPKMFYAQAYASGLRFADKNLRHGLACSAPRAGQAEVAVAFFGRPADGS